MAQNINTWLGRLCATTIGTALMGGIIKIRRV